MSLDFLMKEKRQPESRSGREARKNVPVGLGGGQGVVIVHTTLGGVPPKPPPPL